MKLDVVLLTKNSLKPCLRETLDAVYREVPVNRLLVVDGGSSDGTLELVREYPGAVVIPDPHGTRATSRQKGVEAVETEWHVHVDSDVILQRGWFSKMLPRMGDESVGAVWGMTIPIEKHYWDILWTLSALYRRTPATFQIRQKRYLLHDTLVRTRSLAGLSIPRDLHVFEDEYIGRHIVSNGYSFLKVAEPVCYHNLGMRNNRDWVLAGYLARKYGYRKLLGRGSIVENMVLSIPRAFWVSALSLDATAGKMHALTGVLAFKGWLAGPAPGAAPRGKSINS